MSKNTSSTNVFYLVCVCIYMFVCYVPNPVFSNLGNNTRHILLICVRCVKRFVGLAAGCEVAEEDARFYCRKVEL